MSRHGWLALVPICLWTLSGCIWSRANDSPSWSKRFNNQAISPDHALIEVALVERPLGDDYLNKGLWQHADELLVDLDHHALLHENGLRIGQLVGSPPSLFQQLLLDKRYCSNPQAMIFPAGKTIPIYLGPARANVSYDIALGNNRSDANLEQSRFCLDVIAEFATEGRTKLTFTPKVETDEATLPFQAVPEQSSWELKTDKANRQYPGLRWDVCLGPNQYLLIGSRLDNLRSLGRAAFTDEDGSNRVQRLLVIRNCRSAAAAGDAYQDLSNSKSPSLAVQAAYSSR